MTERHPPLLDTALFFAQHAGADLAEAFDAFEDAIGRADSIDVWLDGAVQAVSVTVGMLEKHTAGYSESQELADQAIQLHEGQEYGQNNSPARRAGVLLVRGRELLGYEKEGLLTMGQSLLGAKERLIESRRNLLEALGLLENGRNACGPLGVMQEMVITGIQKYIDDRDKETGVLRNVQGMLEYGDRSTQKVSHTKQPIEISEDIATAIASLANQRETLAKVEAALNEIPGILQELDHAMAFWFGAGGIPPQLPGLQAELVRLAHQLHLPVTLDMLNNNIKRLELQRKGFEASQGAVEESKGFITKGKEYIAKAASAIGRYLLRGY